jgi:hypothetical protein
MCLYPHAVSTVEIGLSYRPTFCNARVRSRARYPLAFRAFRGRRRTEGQPLAERRRVRLGEGRSKKKARQAAPSVGSTLGFALASPAGRSLRRVCGPVLRKPGPGRNAPHHRITRHHIPKRQKARRHMHRNLQAQHRRQCEAGTNLQIYLVRFARAETRDRVALDQARPVSRSRRGFRVANDEAVGEPSA